uniref:Heme A synthase n=1 Tax=Panagrolaimus sp. ES5 TaxID=591445 RepID=A0AC34GF99_9BILA
GYITFVTINIAFFIGRKSFLQSRARCALNAIMILGYSQLVLGITTLYFRDPAVLAWLHQNLAIILFASLVWFVHEIRQIP